jgi:tetratricopeptide (TPR) repeat protein
MQTDGLKVSREMLERELPHDVDHPDRLLRHARERLGQIERLRSRPPDRWPNPTALPRALDSLATTLLDLGWPDLARLAYLEEVAVYRQLDAAQPGDIRRALTSLRANLVELGRLDEALPVAREELHLATGDRTAREAARTARYWLTRVLGQVGPQQEALESAAAAVSELRTGTPGRYDLAHALSEYARQLFRAGRFEQAVTATAEVAALWHGHGAVERAEALGQLGDRLARVGRYEEARTAWAKAVKVLRRDKHDRHTLANGLHNYSIQLASLGSYRRALSVSEEAVALYREFVEMQRQRHRQVEADDSWDDDHRFSEWYLLQRRQRRLDESQADVRTAEMRLCNELINLGVGLHVFHRVDEAMTVNAEALAIARAHLDADPEGSRPSLVLALNNRSVLLDDLGRYPEALAAASEAVALSGRTDALALHTYSVAASNGGRHDEALTTSLATIDIYRRGYESDPYAFASELAAALTDHGRICSRRGEHAEAFAATTESAELYRRLAEQNPGRHGADCARAMLVFAEVRLAANRSLPEARLAAEEAVARYQQLAGDLPEAHAPDLAQARSVLDRVQRR